MIVDKPWGKVATYALNQPSSVRVITVEPGLYIAIDAPDVPAELRGIGVRIEDDVVVTADGHEVLTAACPKEIEAVEAACRSGSLRDASA